MLNDSLLSHRERVRVVIPGVYDPTYRDIYKGSLNGSIVRIKPQEPLPPGIRGVRYHPQLFSPARAVDETQ